MTTSGPDRGSPSPADPPGPDWLYRWRRRVAGDSRYRQLLWRVVVTSIGAAILVAGVAALVLPGPGWALIFLGLAVLASEYAWAHRLLRFTKDKAQSAASAALGEQNRRRTLWVALIGVLLLLAAISWYAYRYGWTLQPVSGWFGLG